MIVAIVVSNTPHYFTARVGALGFAKNEFTVISATGGGDFAEFVDTGLLRDLPIVGLHGTTPAEIHREVLSQLTRCKPDIVVVAGWTTTEALSAIIWARRNGSRVIVMSASQAVDAKRSSLREAVKSRVVRTCDAALVAGRRQRDYIVSLGMPQERVFLGYDAVDNGHFERGAAAARAKTAAIRQSYGLPKRYLLASGRFIPKKNLPRLIEAYACAIAGLDGPPDLVLLGDGPERGVVEEAINRADVAKRVHLLGFRSYSLLPELYGLADGFVHVSTSEQWGLVINEAAAAGLPLVVSKPCGAASELLCEGENGFLVDPWSANDIAGALRRLITLSADERARMGEASQRIVANWGPERFANGFMAACDAALACPPRPLALWDEILLRALASREVGGVA
jgi:glycosyltransferase involved in cell wall biosynthesis